MPFTFISYSHKDENYALKLAKALQNKSIEYWIDNHIKPGDQWANGVLEALNDCSAFIVLMTPDSERSTWVTKEILLAHDWNKPILPLLLNGEKFPLLIDRQFEDVTSGGLPSDRFFEQLAKVMNTIVTGQSEESATRDNQFERSLVLNDAHYKADLRLLHELWHYINSARIDYIMSAIYNRYLEYDYYIDYVAGYFRLRERPEKHFIDKEVERAFEIFEEILGDFATQFIEDSTVIEIGKREVFKPSYKLPEIDPERYSFGSEDYDTRAKRHDITIENSRKVKRALGELVRFIQLQLPDFDFPNVPLWNDTENS